MNKSNDNDNVQSDHFRGRRRPIQAGDIELETNSASFGSAIDRDHTPHSYEFKPGKPRRQGGMLTSPGEMVRRPHADSIIRNAQRSMGRLKSNGVSTYHGPEED